MEALAGKHAAKELGVKAERRRGQLRWRQNIWRTDKYRDQDIGADVRATAIQREVQLHRTVSTDTTRPEQRI